MVSWEGGIAFGYPEIATRVISVTGFLRTKSNSTIELYADFISYGGKNRLIEFPA